MTKIQKNSHIQVLPGMDFVVPPFFSSSDGGAASFPRLPRRNLLPGKGGRRAWLIKVAGKRLCGLPDCTFAESTRVLAAEYAGAFRKALRRLAFRPRLFPHSGLRPARRRGARGSRLFLPPPTARLPETAAPRARKFWRLKACNRPELQILAIKTAKSTNFGC